MDKPIVAVLMGDPAGIGPELVLKVLADPEIYEQCRPFVVGAPNVMEENRRRLGLGLGIVPIAGMGEARFGHGTVEVLTPPGLVVESIPWGRLDAAMGQAAALCMQTACRLAAQGAIQGISAAPINKQALHMAGYHYLDELEYLAEISNCPDAYMVGALDDFWTAAVTGHVAFRDIPALITPQRVLRYIRGLHDALQRTGKARPRLAVAALNVHGGEGGMFGREEIDAIAPAVAAAREEGLGVSGPIPADTVFVRAREGEFDGVVAMYHDQANIARKLMDTWRGATIFMGLPVAYATTAHGTAFDKAGLGISDPSSLRAALTYTTHLARGC